MQARIYADHNATSPLLSPLKQQTLALFSQFIANPASAHYAGQQTQKWVDAAQVRICSFLKLDDSQIIFTASATEANATVIHHFTKIDRSGVCDFLISPIEHASVLENINPLRRHMLAVNTHGVVSLSSLERALASHSFKCAMVMWVNNETGVIQPIEEIARLCQQYNTPLHIDAVQALGKVDLDLALLPFSTLSFSAHKLGSLGGCGVLVVKNLQLQPLIYGGGHQNGLRSGSLPWHSIFALDLAIQQWMQGGDVYRANMLKARQGFEGYLKLHLSEFQIVGEEAVRAPNTSNVIIHGMKGQVLLSALDLAGVAASHGSACSSGALTPSHVLLAMGLSEAQAKNALRFSFGPESNEDEGKEVGARLCQQVERMRRQL